LARIAVALSGGGNRAALFGLGVLLYLTDAGKNTDVVTISSVSGGSLTNGYVGQLGDFSKPKNQTFWSDVQPLASQLAQRTLWANWQVGLYLAGLVVLLGLSIATWWMPWHWLPRLLLCLAQVGILGLAVQLRGLVVGRAIGHALFWSARSPTPMKELANGTEELPTGPDHVICATHLHAGEHVYFSGRFVYAYRFGWGHPGNLPLHSAVQASAAFPGAFPPRWMRTARFGFTGGKKRPGPLPRLMALADGGVYDNMADEWPSRIRERSRDPNPMAQTLTVPEELVVVNASAGLGWKPMQRLKLPWAGEVLALKRDVDILYDNSATLRRQELVHRFKDSEELDGALIHIEQSPHRVAKAYEQSNSPSGARARAVLAQLGNEAEWKGIAEANSQVATTLSALGTEVAARLLRHGYVLAMANLHVILGYPLLNEPQPSAFQTLVG
jgi:hypothetical protein